MRDQQSSIRVIIALAACICCVRSASRAEAVRAREHKPAPVMPYSAVVPSGFERNVREGSRPTGYAVSLKGMTVAIGRAGTARIHLVNPRNRARNSGSLGTPRVAQEDLVDLGFAGGRGELMPRAVEPLDGSFNYLLGQDSSRWRCAVRRYRRLVCDSLYPGVDLVYRLSGSQLEYDLNIHPGSDPEQISLKLVARTRSGGSLKRAIYLRTDGSLSVPVGSAELWQHPPSAYQCVGGVRVPVACRYVLNDSRRDKQGDRATAWLHFRLGHYDRRRPLIIDPLVTTSTYLGGKEADAARAVAVDGDGNLYLAGTTASPDFPGGAVPRGPVPGGSNAFVAKFSPDGTHLVYATYFGGSEDDRGTGVAVGAHGEVVLVGGTRSPDLPILPHSPPLQGQLAGGEDVFVARFNAQGDGLLSSTYLGGSGDEAAAGVALDAAGRALVVGTTSSEALPANGDIRAVNPGGTSAFVARLGENGDALKWVRMVGGSDDDTGNAIAVGTDGSAAITGSTRSRDFPLVLAGPGQLHGGWDAFVARIDSAGELTFSTLLGGTGDDRGNGIAVDATGAFWITGATQSDDFPVVSPVSHARNGSSDAFVAKIIPVPFKLVFSTYLGTTGEDVANGIALDAQSHVYVVGTSNARGLPLVDAFQDYLGGKDAFVARFDDDWGTIGFLSYFGGRRDEEGIAVALKPNGEVVVVGSTTDRPHDHPRDRIPTAAAVQPAPAGGGDAFVATLNLSSAGKLRVGRAVLEFGSARPGKVRRRRLHITNTGDGVMMVRVSTPVAPFTTDVGTLPIFVPPHSHHTLLVTFAPRAPATYNAFLTIIAPAGDCVVRLKGHSH